MNIKLLKRTPARYPGILAGVCGKITDDIYLQMGTSQERVFRDFETLYTLSTPEKLSRVLTIVSGLMVQKGVG
ncbi:MAG: hypothetical protein ACFCU5_05350 [Pleurocapsa sp.]